MHKNPHKAKLQDEASGIEVPNQRYEDWEQGYQACWSDLGKVIDKLGIELCRVQEKGQIELKYFKL